MIFIILIVILGFIAGGIYNSLISQSNTVMAAYANIDVLLKRRYDIIPNVIETVKGYQKYESETLENIVAMRSSAMASSTSSLIEKSAVEQNLSSGLRGIFAIAENYPELQASGQFQSLQGQLSQLESEIGSARSAYNNTVRNYNIAIAQFPAVLFISFFGFRSAEYFGVEATERENVKISF